MFGHQKREICNSESNRHQTIDVLFDEQKDIQIIQILMRTDSYSTMLEMYAVKKVGFIHIV